ncbi:unnamed protein product, partial [Allacma fusca]
MVKRSDTRWKNVQPDVVAAAMTGISQRPERWLSDGSEKSASLWDALAKSLWPRHRIDNTDRKWLRTIFVENRKNVQGLYRGRINCVLYENVQPLAESTPRPKEQKYCICRKRYNADEDSMICCGRCKEWFHPVCINTDFASAVADSSWQCPQCLGLPQNRFPDGWEDSTQQPRQPLSISDVPFHLNEGNSSKDGGIKDQEDYFNSDGHLSMDHLDSASASLIQENIHECFLPQETDVGTSDCDGSIPRCSFRQKSMVVESSDEDCESGKPFFTPRRCSSSESCSPRRSPSPLYATEVVDEPVSKRRSLLSTIWLQDSSDSDGTDFATNFQSKAHKRKRFTVTTNVPERTGSSPPTALKPMDVRMSINGICCH